MALTQTAQQLIDKVKSKYSPYYVYELIDPRTMKVFYVGKGKGNRVCDHVLKAKRNSSGKSNAAKNLIIDEILSCGMNPIEKIVDSFRTDQEAVDAEEALIALYGVENLTNVYKKGCVFVYRPRGASDARMIAREISKELSLFCNPKKHIPPFPYITVGGDLIDPYFMLKTMGDLWDKAFNGEHRNDALEVLNAEIERKHFGACRAI